MQFAKCLCFPALLAALVLAVPARSATISLIPSSASAVIGAPVLLNLDIAGLTTGSPPGLGAFDLNIGFDPALLDFQSAVFGAGLDALGLGTIQTVTPATGTVNLFELSLDTPSDLIAHQPGSFTLATLTFQAISQGTGSLSVTLNALADAYGSALPSEAQGTSVTITAIPEPAVWLTCPAGLLLLVAVLRRRKNCASR